MNYISIWTTDELDELSAMSNRWLARFRASNRTDMVAFSLWMYWSGILMIRVHGYRIELSGA